MAGILQQGNFKLYLRIGIFIALFLGYLFHVIKDRKIHFLKYKHKYYYISLATILLIGILNAFSNEIPLKNIFLDANAYIYFAYILVITQSFANQDKTDPKHLEPIKTVKIKQFTQITLASIFTISLHSFVLLYIF